MKQRIKQAIVVEGRYDKNALSQVVDTLILETAGFGIFKNTEQMALLRTAAQTRGLIVLTDSDGAGFVIRNRIKSAIAPQFLLHAYIPDVYGKERRKAKAGKEGKLGVEGMPPEILLQSLHQGGAIFLDEDEGEKFSAALTKADLYAAGLTGAADSATRRAQLLARLNLPEHMSTNALLAVLNGCYDSAQAQAILDWARNI